MQKNLIYSMLVVLIVTIIVTLIPSVANAEQSNVKDWLNEEEPSSSLDAEENGENVELGAADDKSPIMIIGQLIFYTIVIVVLIYGLIKFLSLKQRKLQPNQAIKTIGGTGLGNNKSLQLVKVGGKMYLIGVGDQVNLIKEISDADEMREIENDLDHQPTLLSNPITSLLNRKNSNEPTTGQSGDFGQLFKQSLNKQKEKQQQLKNDLWDKDDEEERKQ